MESSSPGVQPATAPTRLQIALAIAILNSKPEGVTVRAHILQLREHVKRGKQVSTSENEHHRHLDHIAYWKARYEECQQRCEELEQRNVQLERARMNDPSNHGLDFDLDDDLVYMGKRNRAGSPRKRAGTPGLKPGRPTKKARRSSPVRHSSPVVTDLSKGNTHVQGPTDRGKECMNDTADERKLAIVTSDIEEVEKAKEALVQKLYLTHKLYKKQSAEPEAICFSLAETARAIGSVVASLPKNYDALATGNLKGLIPVKRDKSEFSLIIQAATRAWASLLVGLKKLVDSGGGHLPNVVIYACIKMFNTIFESIKDTAHQIASIRSVSQRKGTNNNQETATTPRDTGPFRAVAQFLNALIASLNKDDRYHGDIFEGVLFLLMERVSKLLFYFTFDRFRCTTIEGDISMPSLNDDKRDVARQLIEPMAIRLEAQCLVAILERAIGLAPHHMNSPAGSRPSSSRRASSSASRPGTPRSQQRASTVPLVAHARDKLQRTLIQCVFGEEDHDEFAEVLRKPGSLGAMPRISKMEDDDVGDWFSGEVWRLVGWDLLSRESEW